MGNPSVGIQLLRLRLRLVERAISRLFSRRAFLEIDRRLVALELALGGGTDRRAEERAV